VKGAIQKGVTTSASASTVRYIQSLQHSTSTLTLNMGNVWQNVKQYSM
jgi:hypothetical protein